MAINGCVGVYVKAIMCGDRVWCAEWLGQYKPSPIPKQSLM